MEKFLNRYQQLTLLVTIWLVAILMSACTVEQKLKKLGTENAQNGVEAELKQEASSVLGDREKMMRTYVEVLGRQAELQVIETQVQDSEALVSLQQRMVPRVLRIALLGIITKQPRETEHQLNLSDALIMIRQKAGFGASEMEQSLVTFQFVKKDGEWALKSP